MRFYGIKLLSPTSGAVQIFDPISGKFTDSPGAPFTWASHDASGNFISTALNVELDVPALPFGASQGGASLRVWGVGLPALSQANDLAGYGLELQGGMRPPYQLNKAAVPGVLLSGRIYQGFGNWEGLSQHLDIVVFSQADMPNTDAKIPFNWPTNQPLGTAIANALTAAFPTFTVQGQNSVQRLVQDHDEHGYYQSLRSFAEYALDVSQSGSYSGINIRAVGSVFYLYDNASPLEPIDIAFEDMIGQPTWISSAVLTFATVMRGDIQLNQQITMPKSIMPPYALTTPAAAVPNNPSSSKSVFQGTFIVVEVHHYGNFRESSAEAWRTVFVAVPNGQPTP